MLPDLAGAQPAFTMSVAREARRLENSRFHQTAAYAQEERYTHHLLEATVRPDHPALDSHPTKLMSGPRVENEYRFSLLQSECGQAIVT